MSPLFVAVRRIALLCLPFAAVFTAGIMLSPHASADYPGGGYPGGPAGWVFQKHPQPLFYPFDDLYDWTGLDAIGGIDYYDRNSDLLPAEGYGVYVVGEGSAPLMVGGNNSFSRASVGLDLNGTSTYQWKWVPPDNALGQPDLTNFPAPPLYVLGRVFLRADVMSYDDPGDGTGYVGLTGSAKVADGWGYSDSIPKMPGHIPALGIDPVHRHILGPASAAEGNVEVTLSPTMSGGVTGHQDGNRGGLYLGLAENVFPITLDAPDPFDQPYMGDGKSQWLYDDVQPGPGRLRVPGMVLVDHADQSYTAWMANKSIVDVSINPEPPNAMLHYWTSFFEILTPNTLNTPSEEGDFVYNGLPYNNSDFGDHIATLQVNSQNSQQAHFQTFFTAVNLLGQTISNYPNTDGVTANWYYYYNQVINPDADTPETYVPDLPSAYGAVCATQWQLDPNSPWGYDIVTSQIFMGPGGINQSILPVFALRSEADGKQWTTHIGDLHIAGIHSYLRTYLEEAAHADQIRDRIVLPGKNASGQRPPTPDDDLDGVPDSDERKYGLKRGNPDSTGTYQNYLDAGYPGDSEVLAAIVVLGKLLPSKDIWKQDWANTGLQHGSRPPYPCDPSRNIFPWYYHSLETGADTADIPEEAHALTELPNLTD